MAAGTAAGTAPAGAEAPGAGAGEGAGAEAPGAGAGAEAPGAGAGAGAGAEAPGAEAPGAWTVQAGERVPARQAVQIPRNHAVLRHEVESAEVRLWPHRRRRPPGVHLPFSSVHFPTSFNQNGSSR